MAIELDQRQVRLVKLNWDEDCRWGLRTGRDFEITDVEPFKGGNDARVMNGIQSPKFSTDWSNDNAFEERYRCKCGQTTGRVFDGEICPACGSEVKFRDVNFNIYGWIRLNDNSVIQPLYYRMLESLIGKRNFAEIIEYDMDMDRDGNITHKKGKTPFKGIGLIEFKERYEEIVGYYAHKKRNTHQDLIDILTSEKDAVFVSCIPVYSSVLRPILIKDEVFKYNDIDKQYNVIVGLSRKLFNRPEDLYTPNPLKKKVKKKKPIDIPKTLNSIQRRLNTLWDLVFSRIVGKSGHIRDQNLGGRLNYSNRSVIIPDPTLKADEIHLSYLAFLELYRYEIIAHLSKVSNITHNQAADEWHRAAITFDPKIYEIMMYMVKKRKPKVIMNRNPKSMGL